MDRNEPFSSSRTVTNYQVGYIRSWFTSLTSHPHEIVVTTPRNWWIFQPRFEENIPAIDSTNISQNILDLGSHAPIFFEDTIRFFGLDLQNGLTKKKKRHRHSEPARSQQNASQDRALCQWDLLRISPACELEHGPVSSWILPMKNGGSFHFANC